MPEVAIIGLITVTACQPRFRFTASRYTGHLCKRIKRELQVDFTKNRLVEKLRRLKKKSRSAAARIAGGKDAVFWNPHHKAGAPDLMGEDVCGLVRRSSSQSRQSKEARTKDRERGRRRCLWTARGTAWIPPRLRAGEPGPASTSTSINATCNSLVCTRKFGKHLTFGSLHACHHASVE